MFWKTAISTGVIALVGHLCFAVQPAGAKDPVFDLIKPKTIFASSVEFSGDLVAEANGRLGAAFSDEEGLEAGDALCQDLADAEGSIVPEGTYVALLSAGDVHAFSRITPSVGPFLRPDGAPVAPNWVSLFAPLVDPASGSYLVNPPDLDESGTPHGNFFVSTGTNQLGFASGNDCDEWTDDGELDRQIGFSGEVDARWLHGFGGDLEVCIVSLPIYCVQVD